MDIMNIIQNVGFPIACVVALAWFMMKVLEDYRQDMKELFQINVQLIEKISTQMQEVSDDLEEVGKNA